MIRIEVHYKLWMWNWERFLQCIGSIEQDVYTYVAYATVASFLNASHSHVARICPTQG